MYDIIESLEIVRWTLYYSERKALVEEWSSGGLNNVLHYYLTFIIILI
jgi:hypothetical protein